ncbi:molecular chaperone DnaJ [Vibrio toranzoniae]|uniref:Molecular chaperone DnaJ n=1 Tax=Vibrio toranzoniae TaxID=1194427 RepID=A0A120DHL4_9VIBR|nr:DNA-J related domain-containing protein [Vibrio toranzoniae]KWU02660.1 molecular chaperone DnaJ [Vibrio toranzoniae]NAZ93961.1 DnaJ domain-containing protein [Vibrio toranzoniae]SBS32204.1 Chaperone protein DnaJ [Vibrio toranzoniae]
MSDKAATSNHQGIRSTFQAHMENPLLWPILEVLKQQPSGWKVHTLAAHLNDLGLVPVLDSVPEKELFKKNFLIMNALYQLQDTLYPDSWLQVQAMDIELMNGRYHGSTHTIDIEDPLRDYYINWLNYEADEGEVKRLLNEFWTRYKKFVGGSETDMDRSNALSLFELPLDATQQDIRKRWRRLALRWHPDRDEGNTSKFQTLCEAWHVLRSS